MRKQSLFFRFGVAAVLLLTCGSAACGQDDENLEEKFQQGQQLVADEKYEEAIEFFRDLTKSNEDFGPGWFYLGYALHAHGDLDEAIRIHKKAAGFDSFSGIATYNLGCAYALQHKQDAAIEALQQAVENGFDQRDQFETDEDLYSLHTDLRFAKLLTGMAGDEENVARLEEAEELLGTGDFVKAAELYRAILEDDRRNAFASHRLGYSLHGAGKLDEALEVHTKTARFDGVAPIANYNIACVHALQGNTEKAIRFLHKAVDLGFARVDAFQNDADLESVRSDERFAELVARVKKMHSHDHEDGHEGDDKDAPKKPGQKVEQKKDR